MRCAGEWMDRPETRAVFNALTHEGHQAFFVGGCVRNSLIGSPVDDIDIATNATPDEVTRLATHANIKVIPTGIEHGTLTLVKGNHSFEVTTFRKDMKTNGRHAVVEFTDSLASDAQRRDFTINALYATATGDIQDPVNGLIDLENRRVRFIGDPHARIEEDYLRILRFFRFYAWYGNQDDGIDPEGLAAVASSLDGLVGLSKERVGKEVKKLLSAPNPTVSVAAMRASGVLSVILPEADDRALGILNHLEEQVDIAPNPIRRLACVGGTDVATRLRLSRAEAREYRMLRNAIEQIWGAAELGYRLGDAGLSAYLLRSALLETPLSEIDLGNLRQGQKAVFPVTALDLPHLQGADLGRHLKELESRWIQSGFTASRKDLLE